MPDEVQEIVSQAKLSEHFTVLRKAVPIEGLPAGFEQGVLEQRPVLRPGREPEWAEATVAGDKGGHPLGGERIEMMRVTAGREKIHVRVRIDETWRDHLAGAVDDRAGVVGKVTHRSDARALQQDAARPRRGACAVDDQPAPQERFWTMRIVDHVGRSIASKRPSFQRFL